MPDLDDSASEQPEWLCGSSLAALKRLARLASRLLTAPAALIELAGLPPQAVWAVDPAAELPAEVVARLRHLASQVASEQQALVLTDLHRDSPPAEGVSWTGAFFGIPLALPGLAGAGSLCVADVRPREWTSEERSLLEDLAHSVVAELLLHQMRLRDEEGSSVPVAPLPADLPGDCDLAARERRFRTLVEHSSGIVTILREDGTIVYESASVRKLLGYQPEELIGRQAFEFVHPEDRDTVFALFRMSVESTASPTVTIPYRLQAKDGTWRWVESVNTNLLEDPVIRGLVVNSRDVSERIEMEEILRERDRQNRRIVDTASEGIWMTDANGIITYVNAQAARMLGHTTGEMIGRPLQNFVPEEDHPQLEKLLARREQGITEQYDARRRHKNGSEVWVLVSATPLRSEEGEFQGSLAMLTDITERKLAEEALRASEARFRAIFDEAGISIVLVDLEGYSTVSNRALQQWLGYTEAELAAMSLAQLTHPEDVNLDLESLEALLSGELESYHVEKRYLRKDGKVVWGRLTASLVRDHADAPRFVVGMIEDVTERKRAEELNSAFRTLGERLNTASAPKEAAHIVLEVADRLLGWDGCWVELLDAESQRCSVVASMDLIQGVRTEVTSVAPQLSPRPLTRRVFEEGAVLILRKPDELPSPGEPGSSFFGDVTRPSASLLGVPIRNGDRIVGALSVQSYQFEAYSPADVETLQALADYCAGALVRTQAETARHELQEQLVQARKMEAIGRLAGGVAHDFNNMLGVINGYSEILLSRDDVPPAVRSPLEEILRAGKRAATLTWQLLAFSRKQLIRPRVLNLGETVRSMQQMLRRLIGEDIEVITDTSAEVWKVEADPGQIEQVLLNLAVNARDAMPQGGVLSIRVENAQVTAHRARDGEPVTPGQYVCVTVSDTGAGIDAGTLEHIFEPFFTTKPVGQGTGLGLPTVYGIVKQSRGHIEVISEVDRGTTFRLYFPRLVEAEPVSSGEPEGAIPRGEETILVAEDEEMLRRMVCTGLRANGYHVLEASNADEALRCCQEHRGKIDLLLTDVVMPGRSGGQLAVYAAAHFPQIKVMYMSGYTDDAIVRHGVHAAAVHFLQKPFTMSALAQKVREVLDGP